MRDIPLESGIHRSRLIAFPHAGAGASAFRSWHDPLGTGIDLVPIRLPGREERFREPCPRTIGDMVVASEPQWSIACEPPYAVFGHSVGALAAFELVREVRRRRLPAPQHLIVAGRVAPQIRLDAPLLHDLPDRRLVEELGALGGTPAPVLANSALRDLLLPVLRADLACDERYEYRHEAPLSIPLLVLGGTEDPRVPWEGLAEWIGQTSGPCVIHVVPGGHFFVHERLNVVLACVQAAMEH